MKATVTARDDLESVTAEETIRGYGDENAGTAAGLATLADATDCVYFEGGLPDTEGGVVRVGFVDARTVFTDHSKVLAGFEVAAVEPIVFAPISALEAAAERGDVDIAEVKDRAAVEIVDELHVGFRNENGLSHDTDAAARVELRTV